jgi:hypothetical protein
MSWGTCYAGSNNIHFGYPPIMADGRNYADWLPGAAINEKIRTENKIKSNWQYRNFLTANADAIILQNQLNACDQCCTCPARYGDNQPQSNSPFLYKSCTESTQPFGYQTSDLKNEYLSSYQLQCRLVAPILTQDQYLQQGFPNHN